MHRLYIYDMSSNAWMCDVAGRLRLSVRVGYIVVVSEVMHVK